MREGSGPQGFSFLICSSVDRCICEPRREAGFRFRTRVLDIMFEIRRAWLSGKASPSQGEDREFESRRPLQTFDNLSYSCKLCTCQKSCC